MPNINIYNEDCMKTMQTLIETNQKVGLVLTSPPYNTSNTPNANNRELDQHCRYDVYIDAMTSEDYISWCCELFNKFDAILEKDGVVLWNVSYGSDTKVPIENVGVMWLVVADIIRKTNFTVADRIIWKKTSALPNTGSSNTLTRIVEDVFVFCRKSEYKTFKCNKGVASYSVFGTPFYKNHFNFIEARNNDGANPLNKATYSSDLCRQLIDLYGQEGTTIYDPFMGTGTTAYACKLLGFDCIGSELSPAQTKFALERVGKIKPDKTEDKVHVEKAKLF